MRRAGLLVWEAHQLISQSVKPGVTTKQIDDSVDDLFAKHNAIPLFKGYPGEVPFPASTCTSVNEQVVHGIPSDRALREGDIISVDTGCKVGGWCGDSAMTYTVGEISSDAKKLLEVTRQTLQLAIQLFGTKKKWSEVAIELEKYVLGEGFSVIEAFVGHGVGRDMHEPPQAPNFCSEKLLKEEDFELQPGLVIAIEPMVSAGTKEVECLKDKWTQVTKDRSLSAHFEHTVALTDSGPIRLTAEPGSEADDYL